MRIRAGHDDQGIDVQGGGSTAWRPHIGLVGKSIGEGVALSVWSIEGRL